MEHIRQEWQGFLERRAERLQAQERHGAAAEKVAENIVEDLMTGVLDWSLGDVNHQVGYADLVLTQLGIPYLIIETKRPGALAWDRRAVDAALEQACRYAAEQGVNHVAVSDGTMFYAADIMQGGLQDRVFCRLADMEPATDLWWVSVHGLYRDRPDAFAGLRLLPEGEAEASVATLTPSTDVLLHPKYGLPARCFAYVGDTTDTGTWKLPFRCADGSIDTKRLPKAIQSILTNYRGAKVRTVPEKAIPAVLKRLAEAAQSMGHMPPTAPNPAPVYRMLAEVLAKQLRRKAEG